MHDECNCHLVWPTHAVEVIADITEHEIDLIEIGKMIDDFRPVRCGGIGRLRRGGYRKDGTSAGKHGSQNFASMHRQFPYPVWVEYDCVIAHAQGFVMFALPPKADMVQRDREGRFVPEADFDRANMLRLGRFNSER